MSSWLQAVLWGVGGLVLLGVLVGAVCSRRPLRGLLGSAVQGLCALTAVNLLAGLTQVSLGFSWLSVGAGAALGIPGVVGLLLMKVIFPAV